MEKSDIFKALSDPTRFKILEIIANHGNYLCVGMLAQRLGVSQPAVSQHLKVLKSVNLVKANRMGFHVHYSFQDEVLKLNGIKIDSLEIKSHTKCEKNDCK